MQLEPKISARLRAPAYAAQPQAMFLSTIQSTIPATIPATRRPGITQSQKILWPSNAARERRGFACRIWREWFRTGFVSLAMLALLAAGGAFGQSLSGPESLEYDAANTRYLISNRGAGQILARASNGTLSVFTDDPVQPAGMEIVNELVFVNDQGRVRGYRLSNAERVMDYPIPGATFLNGMASDPVGQKLWVTDFTNGRLIQVDISQLATPSHQVLVPDTGFSANGVWFDRLSQRLLVVSWGSNAGIFSYGLVQGGFTRLVSTTLGNFDGITADCDGQIYVSAWSAQGIRRFARPLVNDSLPEVFVSGLSNPADITFNAALGEIASPNAGNSSLSFHATTCAGVLFRDRFEPR